MSLVSSLPPPPGRKETSSSASTSPLDNHDDDAPQYPGYLSKGSTPNSPSEKNFILTTKPQSRPPGLSVTALPSPISKPSHSKESSATSPLLTLTPNSSVDGGGDWLNMGTRSSPFLTSDVPSIPYLQTDGRRSQTDDVAQQLSSLDLSDSDNAGLLSIDSLRERSNSLPGAGLHSNSPPVSSRAYFPPLNTTQPSEYERPRPSRDRPPLSQSYGESTYLNSDRLAGGGINPFAMSTVRAIGEVNNASGEASEMRGFGAIGRPDLRLGGTEYDQNRRRASSQDNFHNPFQQQKQTVPEQISNKFRTAPSLSSHIHHHQKRLPESYNEGHKIRHIRSISQPGPPVSSTANQFFQPGADPQFFQYQSQNYPESSSFKPTRSASLSHSAILQGDEGAYYEKNTNVLHNHGSTIAYGGPSLNRRDMFDYHQNSAISDGLHLYGTSSTPHGSHHVQFAGHIRQASEGALLPSTSLSMAPNMHGHISNFGIHSHIDEDLADQLAGENIDFPDNDDPHGVLADTYFLNPTPSHPLLRNATHTHSMSLDAIPSHYLDNSPIHRTAVGSLQQMPKIVYAVKFKRSQRNFVLGPRISRDLKIGTYVKVEADRGEDLGIVVGKVAAEKYSFSTRTAFSAGMGPPPALGSSATDLKRIIRLATHDEVSLLSLKREEEEELLKICRRKVRERCLPMNVVDAEYQFDRHKLTFFFEAEGRVDFRELVRDLFSMYKTRIWMQQLDKNTSTSAQAIIAPQVSTLQMDFGTPIIAPPSEFADSIILNGLAGFETRS